MINLDDELKNLYNIKEDLEDRACELLKEKKYHSLKIVMQDYLRADNQIRNIEYHNKEREMSCEGIEQFWWMMR